ncbi:MAG: hypothetical protein IJ832_00775 [Bacteroidaceae bacterium]|nr:hypothetical protein [Bacteroidaceae bacterium]
MRIRLLSLFLLLTTAFSALSPAGGSPKIKNSKSPRPKGGDIVVRHSDKISYDEALMPGVQIFVGNVEFFHDGVILKCDSANFYQESNSFAAFDRVDMRQGDTLSLKCDYLFYDGNSQVAQARYKVVLRHRKSTLYTDSLDYDRLYSMGYFFEGGKLVDGNTTLTSDWGQYDAQTRQAVFNYNVELQSPDYRMSTDTLYYNVLSKDAHSAGRSNVVSGTTNIYTENGHFNTANDKAILLNRSVVEDNNRKLVADSIVFDKQQGVAEGFGDFVVNDDANHSILSGDYCYYNDSTGISIAHGRALLKNYTEPDTLFLHADTLKILSYNLKTDSVYRVVHGYYHSRSFREDVQSVADSLSFNSRERRLSLFGNPIVWNGRNQIVGEEIHSFFNDSTIDSIYVVNQALMCEQLDSLNFNQIASKEMHMYFTDGEMRESHAVQNVNVNYFQLDDKVKDDTVVIAMNHAETSLMKTYFKDKKVSKVWTAEAEGTFYPIVFVTPRLRYLDNFAWFDYIRPRDKYDLFEWRGKPADKVLHKTKRREVPYQTLKKKKKETE